MKHTNQELRHKRQKPSISSSPSVDSDDSDTSQFQLSKDTVQKISHRKNQSSSSDSGEEQVTRHKRKKHKKRRDDSSEEEVEQRKEKKHAHHRRAAPDSDSDEDSNAKELHSDERHKYKIKGDVEKDPRQRNLPGRKEDVNDEESRRKHRQHLSRHRRRHRKVENEDEEEQEDTDCSRKQNVERCANRDESQRRERGERSRTSVNGRQNRRGEETQRNDDRRRPSRQNQSNRQRVRRPRRNYREEEIEYDPNRPIKQERVSDDEEPQWGKRSDQAESKKGKVKNKEKPNFGLSGKLAEDTNMYNGVVIKYSEPPEARKPKRKWRLYVFKGDESMPTLYIHRQSSYLLGRDRKVADIPIDHPSCSKQHAAFQYRLVPFEREDGTTGQRIRLYIIDLESANGTFINNKRIDARKYTELIEKDVIKFGYSSREYVLLHEHSKDSDLDDDVGPQ